MVDEMEIHLSRVHPWWIRLTSFNAKEKNNPSLLTPAIPFSLGPS